jgi:hypothetical protein
MQLLTSALLQLSLVAYVVPRVLATTGVASCGPAPDSQIAALKREVAFGSVLRMKTFVAPADSPNKRTFFYWGIVSNNFKVKGREKLTGSPPNAEICDWTHSNPRMRS